MREERIFVDCAQFEEILPDLNRTGTRGMAMRESALAHAESCPRCSSLLAEAESLDRGLRSLAEQESGLQAPARVEAILLQEFRRRKVAVSRRRIRWVAAIGIAAAMLLAVGVSLRHRPAPSPGSGRSTQAPPEVVTELASRSGEHSASSPIRLQPAVSKAPPKRARFAQPAPSNELQNSEEAADFIPLPFADDPSTFEEGAVVRVEMPRAALASFGLPVAAIWGDGRVRADLIVDADGTPHAIRLVSDAAPNRLH